MSGETWLYLLSPVILSEAKDLCIPTTFKHYFVYVMTNRSKTLYTGVTNNLSRRVWEHKNGIGSKFTSHYKLDRLVYLERYNDVRSAIAREKKIKG